MKVFSQYNYSKLKTTAGSHFSRRYFLKSSAMLISLYFVPLGACKRLIGDRENRPDAYTLSESEKEILGLVQDKILPVGEEGPGARDINALAYFEFVLSDKHLEAYNRKLLINGIRWVNETSEELYQKKVKALSSGEFEVVLRDLESFKNGEKWLSKIISYILEALLGAPAYGINPNEIGWKWLGHVPGMPQPLKNKIYGTYGYGV